MSAGRESLSRTLKITFLLGGAKLVAAVLTGSQAVMASALDSLSDGVISGINLRLLRMAEDPPDEEHPFGHGKVEGLASLLQAALLGGVVLSVLWRAVASLVAAEPTTPSAGPALIVMILSMGVSAYLARSLEKAADATGSLVLRSDATHYRMDLWTGGAVVLGLVAVLVTGAWYADPIASLLLGLWMAKDVFGLLREAANELMDRSLSPEERAAVDRVLGHTDPRVLSWHELRTRRSGQDRFVQAHLVFSGDISLAEAHAAAERVEVALRKEVANCHVLLHMDVAADPEDLRRPGAGEGVAIRDPG